MTNLISALHADQVDQSELQSLLLSQFGQGSQPYGQDSIIISDREGNIPVMTLHYTKKFKLREIKCHHPECAEAEAVEWIGGRDPTRQVLVARLVARTVPTNLPVAEMGKPCSHGVQSLPPQKKVFPGQRTAYCGEAYQ